MKINKLNKWLVMVLASMLVLGTLPLQTAAQWPDESDLFVRVTTFNALRSAIAGASTDGWPLTITIDGTITMPTDIRIPAGTNIILISGEQGGVLLRSTGTQRHFVVDGTLELGRRHDEAANQIGLSRVNTMATTNGGGISVNAGGRLIMFGGSIHGNRMESAFANTGGGGGVAVNRGAFFRMDGGMISNNSANRRGGVLVSGGTFDMWGGYIMNNTAATGGGVGVCSGGGFRMFGGMIMSNHATHSGGGVVVDAERGINVFDMHGGEIRTNSVAEGGWGGGGVVVGGGGANPIAAWFYLHGGMIENNFCSGTHNVADVLVQARGTFNVDGGVAVCVAGIASYVGIYHTSGLMMRALAHENGGSGEVIGEATILGWWTTVPDHTLVITYDSTLIIPADVTLSNFGTIINKGTIIAEGTFNNNGTFINYGTVDDIAPTQPQEPLAAPTGVAINGSRLRWNPVAGACCYWVSVYFYDENACEVNWPYSHPWPWIFAGGEVVRDVHNFNIRNLSLTRRGFYETDDGHIHWFSVPKSWERGLTYRVSVMANSPLDSNYTGSLPAYVLFRN